AGDALPYLVRSGRWALRDPEELRVGGRARPGAVHARMASDGRPPPDLPYQLRLGRPGPAGADRPPWRAPRHRATRLAAVDGGGEGVPLGGLPGRRPSPRFRH